ncbi:YciI family protein [Rhizobium sp. BK376]|uniref:YciI family protein n=1 Tax=Rhizobium sp. BK376 TaxID=2512149 RepID=UPI00104C6305|nr:YciI family protein [Rhizobium sp. BK376]TCR93118.1 hypothetical protein EV561_101564 [Rhizobium sp. BK376]
MRYVCLIYNSADTDGTLTSEETDALIKAHFSFDDTLRQSSALIYADALEMPDKASVLRVRDGHVSLTDGPYVETKEHLAGFYVIEAADDAEAREIAASIPSARYGAVELRPVRLLTLPE